MGAIATIVVLIVFLLIGLVEIAVGIAGLVISVKKARSGIAVARVFTAISAVVLAIGILFAVIPSGFFASVVITNATLPDDFAETDIVIEEDGYQDARFTADGVVYETLDLWLYDSTLIGEPVFTYKEAGFMNRSQWGNYYTVDNDHGFRLVSDSLGLLFCPADDKAEVMAYYGDAENTWGYYNDLDGNRSKLSTDEHEIVRQFLSLDVHLLKQTQIVVDTPDEFYADIISKDGLVESNTYYFLSLNGRIYYVNEYAYTEEGPTYTVRELPDEISDGLLEIHTRYKK